MRSQASDPADDASVLRMGGRLLELELRHAECDLDAAREAADFAGRALAPLRTALADAEARGGALGEEVARLQALLRSARAAQAQDTSIDKRLVAAVLVKYVERGSDDVLAVLASMLGCTPEERIHLGVLPRAAGAHPSRDARLSDMWIVRARSVLLPHLPPSPRGRTCAI